MEKILKKISEKFFWHKKNILKKRIQFFLILFVFLVWIFSVKTNFSDIKDISAKIFLENFSDEQEKNFWDEKKFLSLADFLEKIKSWNDEKIEDLEKIYWIKFPKFWEILDERVTQVWIYVHFYFEATMWKWGVIHEFEYDWKILDWKVVDLFESTEK